MSKGKFEMTKPIHVGRGGAGLTIATLTALTYQREAEERARECSEPICDLGCKDTCREEDRGEVCVLW